MKKLFLVVLLITAVISAALVWKSETKKTLTPVTLAEVTHSIFYAPQYVALNEGFFKEEGLDVHLLLRPGSDQVMHSLLAEEAQIGLSGSETTIYQYEKNPKNYVQTFAGLTKRDGSFIVSRKKIAKFTLNDLKGKKIIGGREDGMPEMTLEWVLKKHGLNPRKDVKIDTSIPFADMKSEFLSGKGDFVILFEPDALDVERHGYGYVVASVGALSDETHYTSYLARKSYLENNPVIMKKFTKALAKGLLFVQENNSAVIAKSIAGQFPDLARDDLIAIIDRYKAQDVWAKTPVLSYEAFQHMQEIMQAAGHLTKYADFRTLVNTAIAGEQGG